MDYKFFSVLRVLRATKFMTKLELEKIPRDTLAKFNSETGKGVAGVAVRC